MPTNCEKREDHGAWLNIVRSGNKSYKLDESISIYRIENGAVSSNKFKMMKYQFRLYRRHEKFNIINLYGTHSIVL